MQAEQFVALRARQAGAFSRNQAIAHGISDKELVSRRRSRQIQRIHRAVYADFTGPLPWRTRIWAAWLACGPAAALSDETALRAYRISGDWPDDRVHLDIPHSQRVRGLAGVVLHRRRDFASRLHRSREPPTVRLEVALLTVASRQTRTDRALSIILDACRQRRTTPERLLEELAQLDRLPQRKVLLCVLSDAAQGVHSFLEHAYLHRVERAHGLPTGRRQVRAAVDGRTIYRDVLYTPYGLVVELDGRAGHVDVGSQWRDMDRDNSAALAEQLTLRFGYQLVGDPCGTAAQVVSALRTRGWTAPAHSCAPTCAVVTRP